MECDAEQFQEGDVQAVGHPVQPVKQLVHHEGEGFNEGDAGVGDIVVRPFRAIMGHQAFGVVHEILEAAVIEVG
jgi:hypothetical protein